MVGKHHPTAGSTYWRRNREVEGLDFAGASWPSLEATQQSECFFAQVQSDLINGRHGLSQICHFASRKMDV